MSTAPRTAVPSPRPAMRAQAACSPGPASRKAASPGAGRPRLASALAGALAGLAAGAVLVAIAPVVGRTVVADRASTAAPEATDPARLSVATPDAATPRRDVAPVSAVLASAIDAGVVPAPDPEAARP